MSEKMTQHEQEELSLELTELQNNQEDLLEKYLTFWCGGQVFGISIAQVVQIIQVQEITPLPDFPSYIKGVICLRDEVIPIIDTRLRLGKPEKAYDDHTCVIIISVQDHSFGLVVDGVETVEDIPADEVKQPPANSTNQSRYLMGIAQRESVILLLDVAFLLGSEEVSALLEIQDKKEFF